MTLQHHLAWSLITISGLFADNSLSVCTCVSASKGWKFLDFQWPSQACVYTTSPVLRFYFLMLTLLVMDICSCKFGTSRYSTIYPFFMSSCLLHILRSGLVTLTVGFGSEMSFAVNQADNNPFPASLKEKKETSKNQNHKISLLISAVCRPCSSHETSFNWI